MPLAERLTGVRADIDAACQRAGRDPGSVELLAVSKRQDERAIRAVQAAGQHLFGENRVQELTVKSADLADLELEWHMVGSLQTNKVRDLLRVPRLSLLHTVDRPKLADVLQAELESRDRDLAVLLQVNAAREAQKHGVPPEGAVDLAVDLASSCPRLHLRGIMAMGPLEGDPVPVFESVARLRAELQDHLGCGLPVLSLGMTRDLVEAITAGSTLVRVGTGVFGPRR